MHGVEVLPPGAVQGYLCSVVTRPSYILVHSMLYPLSIQGTNTETKLVYYRKTRSSGLNGELK